MPSSPLVPDQRALLAAVGVAELPQPIPAGLLTLPIFRAAVKRGEADANGVLPEASWRTQVVVAETAGRYTYYEITGDPKLGLPYGGDADVLLAMAALADRVSSDGHPFVNPLTGEFVAPSLRMLARVLDLDMTRDRAERIKGALERLAAVRIRAARMRQLDDAARRTDPVMLPAGNAHPVWIDTRRAGSAGKEHGAPPGGRRGAVPADVVAALPGSDWVAEAEGTEYLITYAWRTEYHRTPRGEDWIAKLRINPSLLEQGERGWVGWIDCPTHAKLTRPIAKRLYQLTANAQARQAPLRFDLATIRQLCGIAQGGNVRTAQIRDDVLAAARELCDHDVLASAEVTSVSRGQYVFHFEPGLQLRVAGWLRGMGTPDFTEQRVLRLLLSSLDVAPKIAERLVAESAGQVRQMLAYVFYQRERGQAIRSPGRYVIDGVANGWSYEGNDDFNRWLRERTVAAREPLRLTRGAEEGAAPPLASLAVGADQAPSLPGITVDASSADEPLVELPALATDVSGWWHTAADGIRAGLHGLVRAYLDRARPAVATGTTLLVVASSDGESRRLSREAHLLADALARASEGQLSEVMILSPQQWLARAGDVDTPETTRA